MRGSTADFLFSSVLWCKAMFVEAVFVCLSLLARPFGLFSNSGCKNRSGDPILLIHGYLHNSSAWIYVKWKLKNRGYGPVYTLNLVPSFGKIEDYALKVQDKVKQIQKITGKKHVILIGHSMGGIVCTYYALNTAPKDFVKTVITIGSPLHGTYVAYLGFGPNAKQMRRGSIFLKQLQNQVENQDHIHFYHIGSKTDQIVIPYHSSNYQGKNHKNVYFNDLGHISLLCSPRVFREIDTWITESMRDLPQS